MDIRTLYLSVGAAALGMLVASSWDYSRYIERRGADESGPRFKGWVWLSTIAIAWYLLGTLLEAATGRDLHGSEHATAYIIPAAMLLVARALLIWHIARHQKGKS